MVNGGGAGGNSKTAAASVTLERHEIHGLNLVGTKFDAIPLYDVSESLDAGAILKFRMLGENNTRLEVEVSDRPAAIGSLHEMTELPRRNPRRSVLVCQRRELTCVHAPRWHEESRGS